jgi:hypothetical protein
MVQLKNDAVPVPRDRDIVIPSLDSIAVAPDSRRLFIKVDYYRDTFDESTNTRTGNEPDSSVVWIMNAETGDWETTVEIPFCEYTYAENNRRYSARMIYSMIGVIRGGRVLLSFPVEGGYSLLFLSSGQGSAEGQRRGFIQVGDDELQYNSFDLSADGILSGLLVDDWNVKLVWWRTDKFTEEG